VLPVLNLAEGGEKENLMARILVVDDTEAVSRSLVRLFEAYGHDAVSVPSGSAALVYLAKDHHFNLILSDIQMPGMDGFEFLAEIRGMTNIPVVLQSGSNDPSLRKRCEDEGVAFIHKLDKEYIEKIEKMLGK